MTLEDRLYGQVVSRQGHRRIVEPKRYNRAICSSVRRVHLLDKHAAVLQEDVMRLELIVLTAVLTLTGCWTPDDVKKTGVVWSGTYAARYDQLARCLSAHTTPYYKATLHLDTNEKSARVTYSVPVTGIPVEVYDIRQTSSDAVEISWSTRIERGHVSSGPLYLMRECGATPMAPTALSSPTPSSAPFQSPAWAPEPETKTPSGR
jgi:hypothetical protein